MKIDPVHHQPSMLDDAPDSLMTDANMNFHPAAASSPAQATPESSLPLQTVSDPDDLVGELLDDSDIYHHIFNPNRASYLDNLASLMRSSMNEIDPSGLLLDTTGNVGHNAEIQNRNHQAGRPPARFRNIPSPLHGAQGCPSGQIAAATPIPSSNLTNIYAVGNGRPSDSLPFDYDSEQMLMRERQIALAQSLLEVPLASDGAFHADGFAASGVDVEMLERDMNPTIAFMRSTSGT